MTIFRLLLAEMRYRWVNALLGVVAVAAAVACLAAEFVLLGAHDRRTEQLVAAKEDDAKARAAQLEEDYRKITKDLGFNLHILPRDQELGDFYADDYAARTMPEEYATRLAKARVLTVNHVLPMLQRKVRWPERNRTMLLVGVRGEVYVRNPKQKPIMEPVAAGAVVLGHELHQSLGLKVGDKIALLRREFTVARAQEERGNKDDITAWVNLAEAQELLGETGKINGILALQCGCEADRLSQIREEVGKLLPDTKVIEFATQAIARAEARNRATREGQEAVAAEKAARLQMRAEREATAAVLVPLALVGAAVWLGLLTLSNVRDRAVEIGVWRALGWRTRHVLALFLGRAVLIGLVGATLGIAVGAGVAGLVGEPVAGGLAWSGWMAWVILGAAGLAAVAAWLPIQYAVRRDPALVLREG